MGIPPPAEQALAAWRVHDRINRLLIAKIPRKGFAAIPLAPPPRKPRGRTVAGQFAHLHRARTGWLKFNGEKIDGLRLTSTAPTRAQLKSAFAASGQAVEKFLRRVLSEGGRVKMFRGSPIRWMSYLISHESHHRGSILLTLKQNGFPLPPKVALNDVWYPWYFGEA